MRYTCEGCTAYDLEANGQEKKVCHENFNSLIHTLVPDRNASVLDTKPKSLTSRHLGATLDYQGNLPTATSSGPPLLSETASLGLRPHARTHMVYDVI